MRSVLAAASAALVAVLLAGCATIPSSGPVQQGDPVPADELPDFDIIVEGPTAGATQQQILDGFLTAAQDPRNNYQVAREFLTEGFADEWQFDASVTIDVLAERETEVIDESAIRVEATPAASLRENGQYEQTESRAPIPLDYRFEQVDGEWRISSAPAGVLLDQVGFTLVFREYTLWFLDPTGRYLVPDVRWYAGRDAVQTTMVQALLAGPAEWLEPGVVSAFPEGSELDPVAVPVSGGVASVSLAGAAFDDLPTVQRMQAQLDATLIGVANIDEVQLTVNGIDQGAPQLASPPVKRAPVDPRSVVFDGETFGHLATSGESIQPISGLSEQVAALAPWGAALGPGDESAAVRNAEGVSLLRVGEDRVILDPRANLVTPAVDGEGFVWSVPADAPDALAWYAPDGYSEQVLVPWSGSSIAAIEVSRDSSRIIALLADGANTHFVAASIQRDAAGRPVALGTVPLRLADVSGTPLDVAWLDAKTVASLTALPDGTTRIVTQELGGFASERDGPVGGVLIDGGNNDVRALTSGGELDVRSGVGWQARASGIRFIAAQQSD